jgi:shikimate kinase
MKTNLTLIGMPGAGKSTTGIILAKNLGLGFFDTDILIQINQQKRLQDILDSKGYLDLRKIEEREILKINIENNVISTGGSAVYSQKAMIHLQSISKMIFLKADFEVLEKRINDFATRGIAKAENQTFKELFKERQILYKKYADITINCNVLTQDFTAEKIIKLLSAI